MHPTTLHCAMIVLLGVTVSRSCCDDVYAVSHLLGVFQSEEGVKEALHGIPCDTYTGGFRKITVEDFGVAEIDIWDWNIQEVWEGKTVKGFGSYAELAAHYGRGELVQEEYRKKLKEMEAEIQTEKDDYEGKRKAMEKRHMVEGAQLSHSHADRIKWIEDRMKKLTTKMGPSP